MVGSLVFIKAQMNNSLAEGLTYWSGGTPMMAGWWNKTLVAFFGRHSRFFNSLLMLLSNLRMVLLQVRLQLQVGIAWRGSSSFEQSKFSG